MPSYVSVPAGEADCEQSLEAIIEHTKSVGKDSSNLEALLKLLSSGLVARTLPPGSREHGAGGSSGSNDGMPQDAGDERKKADAEHGGDVGAEPDKDEAGAPAAEADKDKAEEEGHDAAADEAGE